MYTKMITRYTLLIYCHIYLSIITLIYTFDSLPWLLEIHVVLYAFKNKTVNIYFSAKDVCLEKHWSHEVRCKSKD